LQELRALLSCGSEVPRKTFCPSHQAQTLFGSTPAAGS
jgi:hypothetical protein